MTMEILERIMKENNIPKDVQLMSDSEWECDPTEMDGIFYNRQSNTIVFTQGGLTERRYEESEEWEILYIPDLVRLAFQVILVWLGRLSMPLRHAKDGEVKNNGTE